MRKPEIPSIDELQLALSAFEASATFSPIGGYPLGSHESLLLHAAVREAQEQGYKLGFIVLDIITGYGFAHNADEEFYAASSIKGIYIASLASARPEIIKSQANSMQMAVRDSNNEVYSRLRLAYGQKPLTQWCEDAGVDPTAVHELFPHYTPRILAKLWLRTYDYFSSEDEGVEQVASWYDASRNSPIYENLGERYPVCTKPGWIGGQQPATIDAGIVYAGENPYLMIIMTDAPMDFSVVGTLALALDEMHDYMLWRPSI